MTALPAEKREEPTDEQFRQAGFTGAAREFPRSQTAFRLLCAFNGVTPEQAPAAWRYYPNAYMQATWERVASEADRLAADRVEWLEAALLEVRGCTNIPHVYGIVDRALSPSTTEPGDA